MAAHAVHWHEGMFLRPHHYQAAQRYFADLGRRNHKWDHHYDWGLHALDLDLEALANQRLVIHSLEARLRDGTAVAVPADGNLPEQDLRGPLRDSQGKPLLVYLAVPAFQSGQRNTSSPRTADFRYYLEPADLEDENSGANQQNITFRLLNVQLLIGNQDQAGYEVLPIARIQRSATAEGTPELDASFIPPLLACDAWRPLGEGYLQAVFERLVKKCDWLIERIEAQGVTFERQAPGDALLLKQVQQLNEARLVMEMLASTAGVHPLQAYLELSRILGKLAIFGASRRAPDLPRYDHDDLGTCFAELKRHLDALLDLVVEPEYKERDFVGAGLRMQVSLEPAWLGPAWQLYIGVKSLLEPDECVSLLTRPGRLDMKVGSAEHVESLFRQGAKGLRFVPSPTPPLALPRGLVYFQVIPDPKDPEWVNVQRTLSLALRLNENLIVGSIQNHRRLTIKSGVKNVTMQFSLFALPERKT